jgi:hypothetical protein
VTDGGGVVIDGFVDGAFVVENSFVVDGGGAVFSLLFGPFFFSTIWTLFLFTMWLWCWKI